MDTADTTEFTAQSISSIDEIAEQDWASFAQPAGAYYPFTDYRFLSCLEKSGSVRAETGWAPQHLVLSRNDTLCGVMPLYLKANSQGEFVFDHGWADAYERAGGRYYPKLLGAIPFTPATGPRILAPNPEAKHALATAAAQFCTSRGLSSLHINFPDAADRHVLSELGYLIRTGTQYRFEDQQFGDWQGFLDALASRKRKALRKERDGVAASGVKIEWITGTDITEDVLDHFWVFYQDTGARKWGSPYLTRTFFSLIAEQMPDQLLFIMARLNGEYIGGAMNLIGGDTLFGRYWGCTSHIPFLHFECCYYQAIDYALAHNLKYVDAGAQGEHKIARGYVPIETCSAHFLPDPGFSQAVENFLHAEQREVDGTIEYLQDYTPFKKSP